MDLPHQVRSKHRILVCNIIFAVPERAFVVESIAGQGGQALQLAWTFPHTVRWDVENLVVKTLWLMWWRASPGRERRRCSWPGPSSSGVLKFEGFTLARLFLAGRGIAWVKGIGGHWPGTSSPRYSGA